MDDNVHLLDGVLDEAKVVINKRAKRIVKEAIDTLFDYLEGKTKDFPEVIKQFRDNPELEKEITALWSENLFKQGLVSNAYSGLSDNLLISNLHQEGYIEGLYIGYILAMISLVESNAPKDTIISARDYIRPNLIGHHYNDREEFINLYKNEKYNWIDNNVSEAT